MTKTRVPSIEELIDTARKHFPDQALLLLRRAYEVAAQAHAGQKRDSGAPYVEHCLAVAGILADLRLDPPTLAAALLHDVLEDTEITLDDLNEQFGQEVSRLVDGVTKLSRIKLKSFEENEAESLRKMFLAMADDIRVVLIKLADRLHNMRTLDALSAERQRRIAQETLDIFRSPLPIGWASGSSRAIWRTWHCAIFSQRSTTELLVSWPSGGQAAKRMWTR